MVVQQRKAKGGSPKWETTGHEVCPPSSEAREETGKENRGLAPRKGVGGVEVRQEARSLVSGANSLCVAFPNPGFSFLSISLASFWGRIEIVPPYSHPYWSVSTCNPRGAKPPRASPDSKGKSLTGPNRTVG